MGSKGGEVESESIVIVGGGICGLATSLALHRKGIKSLVLERSKSLRANGAGIIMHANGWRALDQLDVASDLRQTALRMLTGKFHSFDYGKPQDIPQLGKELRCLKRMDLIETLAAHLPQNTIRFGCDVTSIELDSLTSTPILHFHDGTSLNAKVVIGCDGVNSTISNMIGVKATNTLNQCVVRGFTNYPNGHVFGNKYSQMITKAGTVFGYVPVTTNLVYWWITTSYIHKDSNIPKSKKLIKDFAVEAVNRGFPSSYIEIVNNCSPETLHFSDCLNYIAPWDILLRQFRTGTVTVAGDALHAMAPFTAQGGSASLEDAVVLARCLARKLGPSGIGGSKKIIVEQAFDEYLKERKPRIFWMCLQVYVIGKMRDTSSTLIRLLCIMLTVILFRDHNFNTRYDCGKL